MTETKLKPEQAIVTPKFKMGTFTRDQTAVSGDVPYTGVGFKPTHIIFLMAPGVVDNTHYSSYGFDDGTNHFCTISRAAVNTQVGNKSIFTGNGASDQCAIVKTFDPDGFTLTWTKDGTPPAGTMNIYYMAFR
jgi:hypothetical protein